MHSSDLFFAFGGVLLTVSVALTIAAIGSGTAEVATQLECYASGKGFFQSNDLYALVLVPIENDSTGTDSSRIASPGARKQLQAAMETLIPTGKDLIRTAASTLSAAQLQTATTMLFEDAYESATIEILFEKNSTTAASGVLVAVDNLRKAKELAAQLMSSKGVLKNKLPGSVRAVRLTGASCDTSYVVYPAQFRFLDSMPVVRRLFSPFLTHEQSVVRSNNKRVRIGALSTKEHYQCTITATGYKDRVASKEA